MQCTAHLSSCTPPPRSTVIKQTGRKKCLAKSCSHQDHQQLVQERSDFWPASTAIKVLNPYSVLCKPMRACVC
eukprot:scaffold241318_cov19-Tisochrysis_lutea.AAC.1